jgi:hypothetical protein
MNQVKPYTYIITNEITGHWYIGKKTANEVPAVEDITYWGSSRYLKELMREIPQGWTKTIIAEYESFDETGLAEEELIKEYWDLPGRVNKSKGCGKGGDMKDPVVKAKHLAATTSPEYRAKISEITKNAPEEIKQKRIDAATAAKKTPEYRNKISEITKNRRTIESKETKKKRSDACTAAQKARAKVIIATCIATGEEFEMQGNKEIESYRFNQGAVWSCCKGKYAKTNIHKGYSFRYK